MNLPDKITEILIGLAFSGLLSAVVWGFKWVNKIEDRLYASDRDIKHLQNNDLQRSTFASALDVRVEKLIASLRKQFWGVHERTRRLEVRVYVIEIRVGDSLTQAISRQKSELIPEGK